MFWIRKSVLTVALFLCFASIVLCYAPAKPVPAAQFQASFFTLGSFGYEFQRGYIDTINHKLRFDWFSQKGVMTDSYLKLYSIGKMYKLNSTACQFYLELPAWADPFGFLTTATYAGNRTLPDGSSCNAWENKSGFGSSAITCWRNNVLMMQIISGKDMPSTYIYTTDYEPYVDNNVFDLPKNCRGENFNVKIIETRVNKPVKHITGLNMLLAQDF